MSLVALPYATGPVLPRFRVLAIVAGALPFFVVAALVANTGLHLRIMDVRKRLTTPGMGPELPLLTAALPALPVLSVMVACLPVLWASRR
ncbi:MAG: hypothetical protein LC781_06860 [Actinobacteria bacterium]|nr:hypothetical protein [Actinomycetota bacterium]